MPARIDIDRLIDSLEKIAKKDDSTETAGLMAGGATGVGAGVAASVKARKKLKERFRHTPKGKLKARHVVGLPVPGLLPANAVVQYGRLQRELGAAKSTPRGVLRGLIPSHTAENMLSRVTRGKRGVPAAGLGLDFLRALDPTGLAAGTSIVQIPVRDYQTMKRLGVKKPLRPGLVSGILGKGISPWSISATRRALARKAMSREALKTIGRTGGLGAAGALLGFGGAKAVKALTKDKKND